MPADRSAPERARREAIAVARLDHPGIVALFDAGEEGGARYLVSELVDGRTLAQLEADGALSDRDVLRVGLALADALAHAHERGVIHRDVKPQNVIVPDDGGGWLGMPRAAPAKLTDFGVAHLAGEEPLTRTGDVVGTLAYMAPEQAAGRPAGEAADLYSLALVLYEALAGRHPVKGASPQATAKRLGKRVAPLGRSRRDLPEELCAAIDRALAPGSRGARDARRPLRRAGRRAAGGLRRRRHDRAAPARARPAGAAARAGPARRPRRCGRLAAAALIGLTPEPAVPVPARGRGGRGAGGAAAARGLAGRGARHGRAGRLRPLSAPGRGAGRAAWPC